MSRIVNSAPLSRISMAPAAFSGMSRNSGYFSPPSCSACREISVSSPVYEGQTLEFLPSYEACERNSIVIWS